MTIAVGRKRQGSPNILLGEFREVVNDFIFRHSGGQLAENIIYRNSQAPNARFAAALAGLYGDNLAVIYFGGFHKFRAVWVHTLV